MSVVAALLGGAGQPLLFNIVPTMITGSRSGLGSCTTPSATTTISGGVAPYSHSWTFTSGDTGFTANSSTSSITNFTTVLSNFGELQSAVWKCTVTDALGQTAFDTLVVRALETSYV